MVKAKAKSKQRARRGVKAAGAHNQNVLAKLQPGEAAAVLRTLLEQHPGLVPEAEQLTRGLITHVDARTVADEVEHAVLDIDLDDFDARAGRHSRGYTPPTEAANELLLEALEPFLAQMRRHLELGSEGAAIATCQGIVSGLYRCRGKDPDGVLGWAEDFPEQTAWLAVETLAHESAARHGRVWQLPAAFAAQIPDWADLVDEPRAAAPRRDGDRG